MLPVESEVLNVNLITLFRSLHGKEVSHRALSMLSIFGIKTVKKTFDCVLVLPSTAEWYYSEEISNKQNCRLQQRI